MINFLFFSLVALSKSNCEMMPEGLMISGAPFRSSNLGKLEKLESCEFWKEDSDILLMQVTGPKEGTNSLRDSTTLFILKQDGSGNWQEAFHYIIEQRVYPSGERTTQPEVLKFPLELKKQKDGRVFAILATINEKVRIK